MNYIQRNRNTILAIAGGLVVLTALIVWALQKKEYGPEDVIASVSPVSVIVGEPVTYQENSPFGETRKWIFGDGKESTDRKGTVIFDKPGFKEISVQIDNKHTKIFNVLVNPSPIVTESTSPTIIRAPSEATQFRSVTFTAVSDHAKSYDWKFGETDIIDASEKMASYAFKKPGDYLVKLYTDVDAEPVFHQIHVIPAYPEEEELEMLPPPVSQEEAEGKVNDDFRYHLQQIANGNNFNFHYNYLIDKYLCSKPNVSVTANERDTSFYYYCTGLQFDKNNLIQEVKLTVNPGQSCVTKVDVKQSKQ